MKEIRVGILVNSNVTPLWLYTALEKIQALDGVRVVAMIHNPHNHRRKEQSAILLESLYKLFLFLERHVLKLRSNALEKKDISELYKNIPTINAGKDNTKHIEKLNLDVLLNLSPHLDIGSLCSYATICMSIVTPRQCLSCHDNFIGFQETYEGAHTNSIALRIVSKGKDEILKATHTSTNLLSYSRNRNQLLWTATQFYPRAVETIRDFGIKTFLENAREKNDTQYAKGCAKFKARKILLAPLKTIPRYILRKARKLLYKDQWSLLYTLNNQNPIGLSGENLSAIKPELDRFWADPFVVKDNQDYYVFFEELFYKNEKGHIAYFKISGNGAISSARKILEKPYHLSYPFIFQHQNEYYMIPESAENRSVDLYKCLEFPNKWVWSKTLLQNLYAVDTTLFAWNGKWWLFTNIRGNEEASSYDELFLFYADDLFAKTWTPHPQNPIVSDVRSARPAGKIFLHQDKLYRPSQDSSVRYGYGLRINQINALSETDYAESCVEFIKPSWQKNIIATHTFNSAENLTVVDAMTRRRKF